MNAHARIDGNRPARAAKVEPRGLRRDDAARYVGISASLFDMMVKDGRMPQPKRINSATVWDRYRLDDAFDALPDKEGDAKWRVTP